MSEPTAPKSLAPDTPVPDKPAPGTNPERPAGVRPGSGWPEDPATPDTPVAANAGHVRALAADADSLAELAARESVCRACPRLVRWREHVAVTKRRSFQADTYWGRPLPSWGDDRPSILILGLAPAAHGGNRTGRMFTGDRSGDFLFASLWRCGLATQPTSTAAGDGERLISVRLTAVVRCAPPENKPLPVERDTCAPWLARELKFLGSDLRVIVCLGHYAWMALWPQLASLGIQVPRPRPAFGHAVEVNVPVSETVGTTSITVLGSYHPSQQNTFTGRVTESMLDAVFGRARALAS